MLAWIDHDDNEEEVKRHVYLLVERKWLFSRRIGDRDELGLHLYNPNQKEWNGLPVCKEEEEVDLFYE